MTQILEKIIGKEIMEYAYFQGNILNIIEELANYCTKEEAKKFIDNMDLMVFLLKKDDEKSKKTRKELLDKKLHKNTYINILCLIIIVSSFICLFSNLNKLTKY